MGKTDSIKERRVDVYLDTLERKERWKRIADEEDESLSKFVQKAVEYAIEHGGFDYAELGEQSKKIQSLEQEVSDLRQEVEQKDIVIEKLRNDLQRHRMQPFLDEDYEGVREYDQELIALLKEADRITGDELVRRLDIDPTQSDLMKGLNQQLEQLEAYGLISNTSKGWRWDG